MDQAFEHVVIVGCGLLGASLGLAMRRSERGRLAVRITGVGRRGSASLERALARGAVDRVTDDLALAAGGGRLGGEEAAGVPADLIVLCTPLLQFPGILETLAGAAIPGAIVTDVGSVKGQVMRWARDILPGGMHFVGSHPMAGSEQSGPEAARVDLFEGAVCIVCPDERPGETGGAAAQRVKNLWRAVGMRVTELPAEMHDQHVAAISHLPHLVAALLVNSVGGQPEARELAAGGFMDTTRIAAGDVMMWTDILLTNREAILRAWDGFMGQAAVLRGALEARNEDALRDILSAARDVRKTMRDRRQGSE